MRHEFTTLHDFMPFIENGDVEAIASDIDFTLVDFGLGQQKALEKMAETMGQPFADALSQMFSLVLEGHRKHEDHPWEDRQKFEDIISQIAQTQGKTTPQEARPWSRESWIKLIAEKLDLPMTAQKLEEVRDLYWQSISDFTPIYEDAAKFLEVVKAKDLPLILMTGSDSNMETVVTEDGFRLHYNPDFAHKKKETRITHLPYHKLIIGDPIDKPFPGFFDRVENALAEVGQFDKAKTWFIGDSPVSDLLVPEERGFPTVYLKRK